MIRPSPRMASCSRFVHGSLRPSARVFVARNQTPTTCASSLLAPAPPPGSSTACSTPAGLISRSPTPTGLTWPPKRFKSSSGSGATATRARVPSSTASAAWIPPPARSAHQELLHLFFGCGRLAPLASPARGPSTRCAARCSTRFGCSRPWPRVQPYSFCRGAFGKAGIGACSMQPPTLTPPSPGSSETLPLLLRPR